MHRYPHVLPAKPQVSAKVLSAHWCLLSRLFCRGVTAVLFRDYALGCLGFIPGTVAYVFIGTTASSLLGDDDDMVDDEGSSGTVQLIVIIVGAVATVIAVVLISVYAKRALAKVLAESEEQERSAEAEAAAERGEAPRAPLDDNSHGMIMTTDDLEAQSTQPPLEVDHPVRHTATVPGST